MNIVTVALMAFNQGRWEPSGFDAELVFEYVWRLLVDGRYDDHLLWFKNHSRIFHWASDGLPILHNSQGYFSVTNTFLV